MNSTLSITLSREEIYLKVGTWYHEVSATVNSPCPECVSVTWHSNNPSVASVGASNGYIHANGVGTTTIYATATDKYGNSCSDSLTVTVSRPILASSVTLDRENISLEIGTYTILSATVLPENTTNDSVTWYSSNPCVASVSGGTVFAHAEGEAIIRATTADGSGKTAECTVTVYSYIPVTGLEISSAPQTMNVGDTATLTATVCPCNATNTSVTWNSNNTNVVEIEPYTGNVTAKNPGIATITVIAVDSNHIATCEVWVRGKTPVFLIHGRTSNSFYVWGAGNSIFVNLMDTSEADNNHYNSSINALSQGNVQYLYTNKNVQDIVEYKTGQTIKVDGTNVENFTMPGVFNGQFDDGKYTCEHPEGGNLAYYLKSNGYKENINLFVFNYPNEEAVKYSAQKFEAYINNLISYVRTSGSNEMKACF